MAGSQGADRLGTAAIPSTTAISGVFFDGFTSRDHDATLHLGEQTATLRVPTLNVLQTWQAEQLSVEPPIAGVRRSVKFPDGSRFETRDDAAISAWERRSGRNRMLGRVRRLEARWSTALISLGLAVLILGAFVQFGIPALARQAADATPVAVLAAFDRETLRVLEDQRNIVPTRLSAERQAELQRQFAAVVTWAERTSGEQYPYRLLLRSGENAEGGGVGANAFALPNGTIVMTDQLVKLARDDRELMGVLAHETGHVSHRHGVARVYQALGLTLVTTVITGDLISTSTFAAAVPIAILSNGYSRAAETESDEVAAAFMLGEYQSTVPLQRILARLEDGEAPDVSGDETPPDDMDPPTGGAEGSVFDLLNTHPGTPQRIAHLKALEQAAKNQP